MQKSTIKVLLMSPQYDDKSIPPFGIAYLAGFLRNQPSIELTAINSDEKKIEDLEKIVANGDYDVFATGGLITCLKFSQRMFEISAIKRPQAKRVVGGPLTVIDHNLLFKILQIDVAVLGEGEETLSELLAVMLHDGDLSVVKGISFRKNDDTIHITEFRPPIDLLKTDLMPDWSFVDMERYITYPDSRGFFFNRINPSHPYRVGYIMAGRGCSNRCHFCFSPLGRFRRRTAENIVREMKYWRDNYSVDHIRFINENLFVNSREIQRLCKMMIDEKVNLHWSCSLRVNYGNRESLKLMKEAGCDYIIYGVESGSDRILKRMNKHTTVEQNRTSVRLTREAGIYPDIAVMFGYCDETLEDMKKTVDLMLEGDDLPESLAITTAMPGTAMYKELFSNGLIVDELEYIEKMCSELSKSSISGYRRPIINPTKIPDNNYWETILSEKRRLFTEQFLKNRAIINSSEYNDKNRCLNLTCPHCGFSFDVDIQHEDFIERYFCQQCLRYIWIDPYMMPELQEHFDKVSGFLQKVQNDRKSLVLFIPESPDKAFRLFEIDPWNRIWPNVSTVIANIDEFFYFKVVQSNDAQLLAPSPVLIMDTNSIYVRKRLIHMGFSANEIMSILPTKPIRDFYQIKKQFVSICWFNCPAFFKPIVKKIYKKFKELLERK